MISSNFTTYRLLCITNPNRRTSFELVLCIFMIFTILLCANKVVARDWYVSQTGAGAKNGTSVSNAWAGWAEIDWDTDASGPDTGVGGGDTLFVIGTIRALTYPVNGYGLSNSQRLKITSYPGNHGKLWQGLEITGSGWKGPDAYGAYRKSVSFPTNYHNAVEWKSDPWTNAVALKTMSGVPDRKWTGGGLYYCDYRNKIAYYKPTSGMPDDKTLTAWASTSRAIVVKEKDYVTISGLTFNNPILIYNGANHNILENCEIFCSNLQTAVQIGAYPGYKPANYGMIKGNYIHDCGNGIYFINQGYGNEHNNDHWTVENNYIANIHGNSDSHGIGVQGGSGNLFQFNSIYNAGTGITFWNDKNQIMQNNIVRFNRINYMGYITNTYYKNGILTNDNGNGRGIEFSGETSDSNLTTGNLIYGNVISDCYRDSDGDPDGVGIRIKNGIPSTGYSIKVFNNTVSDCFYSFFIMPSNYENYEVGAYFHNNISHKPKSGGYHVYILVSSSKYYVSLDNNIYYGIGHFCYEGKTYGSLPTWKSAVGCDQKSFNTNPNLSKSLLPQVGGCIIDSGEDLSALSKFALHPSTVFPTGVNNGNVIVIDQSAYGSGWEIGAYIYPAQSAKLQAPQNLHVEF